ncbi:putative signal transducing protein [Seonamhaeicola sp. ML3]|uniref:putative signal transducing protein n=1 Tax=Seonamhaeicola sp. ML3 TaxID=2937786 RepID=UPI00200C8819|nr:DUF2007 domain-containing protein [Seonamhaeicola sp. ML3]
MTDSNYTKVFTGSSIVVQRLNIELQNINITPVIKDETESARLAGFGGGIIPGFQEVYVHNDELEKALTIVEAFNSELQD